MTRVEGTWMGRRSKPSERELANPIAQLSLEYIGLLREAHSSFQAWEPTSEQKQKVEEAIERIKIAVPEINEESLRKMVYQNPNANKNWIAGGRPPHDITEFHVLAMNWENKVWSKNRRIAERDYGVTKTEVDFLKKGAMVLPPAPHIIFIPV